MNKRPSPARLVVLVVLLFVASSGFMLFLSSGALAKLVRGVHLSAYRRVGEGLRVSLERGLRFGRPLTGYAGLGAQVDNARRPADGLTGLAVVDTAGHPIAVSIADDQWAWPAVTDIPGGDWRETPSGWVCSLPLIGRDGRPEGFLVLAADPVRIRREQARFWRISLGLLAALAAVAALGMSGWAAALRDATGAAAARRWYRLCLLFAGGGQVVFCLPLLWLFAGALSEAEAAKIAITARTLVWDVERLLDKGVRLDQVRGLHAHLETMVHDNPEILGLRLGENGRIIARAGLAPPVPPAESRSVLRYWPDAHTPWREAARLEVWMDPAGVRAALWQVGKNLITALLVSLLFLNETARCLTLAGPVSPAPPAPPASPEAAGGGRLAGILRLQAFAFFIAYDLSMSFVPLHAASLPSNLSRLAPGVVAALPLTMEAALVGAGMLVAGRRSRGGGRGRLLLGGAAALLGSLLSWQSGDVAAFCLARGVAGFGFGLFLMAAQLALLGGGRAAPLGELYAGVLAGSLCGLAGGAMVAELAGYGRVFLVSAAAFVPVLLLTAASPVADPPT
ncbi:MAG: hypothetical protein LIP77_02270, partial [Planctomycetes bacterium]|nr:hypothetical protein [Planctomycetota bacterium]